MQNQTQIEYVSNEIETWLNSNNGIISIQLDGAMRKLTIQTAIRKYKYYELLLTYPNDYPRKKSGFKIHYGKSCINTSEAINAKFKDIRTKNLTISQILTFLDSKISQEEMIIDDAPAAIEEPEDEEYDDEYVDVNDGYVGKEEKQEVVIGKVVIESDIINESIANESMVNESIANGSSMATLDSSSYIDPNLGISIIHTEDGAYLTGSASSFMTLTQEFENRQAFEQTRRIIDRSLFSKPVMEEIVDEESKSKPIESVNEETAMSSDQSDNSITRNTEFDTTIYQRESESQSIAESASANGEDVMKLDDQQNDPPIKPDRSLTNQSINHLIYYHKTRLINDLKDNYNTIVLAFNTKQKFKESFNTVILDLLSQFIEVSVKDRTGKTHSITAFYMFAPKIISSFVSDIAKIKK